ILPDGRKFWTGNEQRVNPNWGAIELHTAAANSWYNAMQFGVNKRLSKGFQFQSSYTWAKVLDETQGQAGADNQVSSIFGVDPSNRRLDRGPADFDLRHNWQFNAIYQLPQPFQNRALSALLNGWRASSILSVQSGYPVKQLGDSGALDFRGEFFNILNHPNFGMNDTFRQVFAGNATGEAPLPTAGVITTTGSARSRQIQFALRLLF